MIYILNAKRNVPFFKILYFLTLTDFYSKLFLLVFSFNLDNMRHETLNEPPHDKTNKMTMRPTRTQISLGIRPVWSESSLCAQWVAKDPSARSFCWLCHVAAQITSTENKSYLFHSWTPKLVFLFVATDTYENNAFGFHSVKTLDLTLKKSNIFYRLNLQEYKI